MSLFHLRTAEPISTKFCKDLHTRSGKILFITMTLPTQPPGPRVPQAPKPKRAAPGLGWLVFLINDYKVCSIHNFFK